MKNDHFYLLGLGAQNTSKNDPNIPPKMTSRSLSGAPPGGERRPETGLRGAKRTPRRSQEPSIQFSNCPFLAQNALLRPTWRPRRFRRSPEARLGLPTTRNWTPGGVEFDPRGLLFWTRGRRFLQPPATHFRTQVRPYCAYTNFKLCQHFSWCLFHCLSVSVCCARVLWSVLCLHVCPYLARRNTRSD